MGTIDGAWMEKESNSDFALPAENQITLADVTLCYFLPLTAHASPQTTHLLFCIHLLLPHLNAI